MPIISLFRQPAHRQVLPLAQLAELPSTQPSLVAAACGGGLRASCQ